MGLTNSNGFRGSAAFFALLLAGASGAAADAHGADAAPSDHNASSTRHPDRLGAPPARQMLSQTGSKFSRRLLPPVRTGSTGSMLA